MCEMPLDAQKRIAARASVRHWPAHFRAGGDGVKRLLQAAYRLRRSRLALRFLLPIFRRRRGLAMRILLSQIDATYRQPRSESSRRRPDNDPKFSAFRPRFRFGHGCCKGNIEPENSLRLLVRV